MSELPVEWRMVADELLLVDGYKVDIGGGGKIGEEFGKDGLMFFITLEGRLNKSDERRSVYLMMDAKFGFDFSGEFLDRMEMVMKAAGGK